MYLKHIVIGACLSSAVSALVPRTNPNCPFRQKDHPPKLTICGKTGDVVLRAKLTSSPCSTQAACADLCLNNPPCLSFSYDSSSKECTQYSKSVASQVFLPFGCDVSWFDKSCYERNCPTCPGGQTSCNGTCTTLGSDNQNCGACGKVCSSGQTCSSGQCIDVCPVAGQTRCSGTCTSLNSDNQNCGRCGNVCGNAQVCSGGECIANPAGCDNQGLEWAIYPNTDAAGRNNENTGTTYPSFSPSLFKTRNPTYQAITTTVGGFNSGRNAFIYGSQRQANAAYYAINHRGYLFATESGRYTITIGQDVDDIVCVWIGPNAYSGWTRGNENKCLAYRGADRVFTVDLTEGTYNALRIVFGQGQGVAAFSLSVQSPSGITLLDSNTAASNYIVRKSCDGIAGPTYTQPFGSET